MTLDIVVKADQIDAGKRRSDTEDRVDSYFSADVETDGPIPGPYSMLSFALVYAGSFDGRTFKRPAELHSFYRELKPISDEFESEALKVNGLDRAKLCLTGEDPRVAMLAANRWILEISGDTKPVLVAYPLSFDWTWLYWYFIRFCREGSPFGYSQCFDIKTALAVKGRLPVSLAGRSRLERPLRSQHKHTHNAVDDAISQAEIFANVFEWGGNGG
jgi:hypothetical protein